MERDGATINQKTFVKAIVKYVLTANNPLTFLRDFEKEKRVFLNYWKAIASILDDGSSAVVTAAAYAMPRLRAVLAPMRLTQH
jgi:hypothetical protein